MAIEDSLYIVELMGIPQLYWLPEDNNTSIPQKFNWDGITWKLRSFSMIVKEIPQTIFHSNRSRTIFVRNHPQLATAYIKHLYWLNEIDLQIVDEKIKNGTAEEKDFEHAVVTFYDHIMCKDGCDRQWNGLIMPRIEINISNPPYQNTNKLYSHDWPACPHCGTLFREPVVKIFGELVNTQE